jgi:hypothetical protein
MPELETAENATGEGEGEGNNTCTNLLSKIELQSWLVCVYINFVFDVNAFNCTTSLKVVKFLNLIITAKIIQIFTL